MKVLKSLSLALVCVLLFALLSFPVSAARPNFSQPTTAIYNGILTYRVSYNSGITITKCNASASGVVEIPAEIDGVAVTSIGDYSFQHCVNITGVVIPDSITNIGYSAFYGCTSLKSIDIPLSVTKIEYGAFYNCKSLKTATIVDLKQWCAVEKDGEYSNPAHITGTLLLNGKPLTDVVIPDGITAIEDYTFYGCATIESMSIPDSVTSIGECAFYGCEKLDKMTVSSKVSEIGDGAFSACDNVTVIDIDDSNTYYKNIDGCLVELSSKTLIKGFNNGKIPTDGSVTRLGEYAFSGCESLTSITVPDCVEVVGSSAFSNCEKLTDITLPAGLTVIRSGVFSDCTALTKITLPEKVETIGISAFRNCTALTDIALPESLSVIQSFAFANCTALTEIAIPKSVSDIGDGIFDGCAKLYKFIVPEGGKYSAPNGLYLIDSYSGALLRGSKYTVIPNFVSKIGKCAFSGIKDIEVIGIPETVKEICLEAFAGCDGLKKVYYGGADEATWDKIRMSSGNELFDTVKFVYGNDKAPVPKYSGPSIAPSTSNADNNGDSNGSDNSIVLIIVISVVVVLIAGAIVTIILIKKKKFKQ